MLLKKKSNEIVTMLSWRLLLELLQEAEEGSATVTWVKIRRHADKHITQEGVPPKAYETVSTVLGN